eukprot:159701-Chlamydomonas_euryale.AAC.4
MLCVRMRAPACEQLRAAPRRASSDHLSPQPQPQPPSVLLLRRLRLRVRRSCSGRVGPHGGSVQRPFASLFPVSPRGSLPPSLLSTPAPPHFPRPSAASPRTSLRGTVAGETGCCRAKTPAIFSFRPVRPPRRLCLMVHSMPRSAHWVSAFQGQPSPVGAAEPCRGSQAL